MFEDTAFSLKNIGDISKPVESQFGFHIIKLEERKKLKAMEFSALAEDIKKILEKDKFDSWMNKQKKELNVKVQYELLDEIKEEEKVQ